MRFFFTSGIGNRVRAHRGSRGCRRLATGETLTTNNLVLDDGKDFVAYETFAAKVASYSRTMKEGTTWATLCLPFAIDLSQVKECKFYRLTGIDNDCITLESYEEGAKIPAGTPVLFKMNEGKQTLSISAQDAGIVKEPVAGTNTDEKERIYKARDAGGKYHLLHPPRSLDYGSRRH